MPQNWGNIWPSEEVVLPLLLPLSESLARLEPPRWGGDGTQTGRTRRKTAAGECECERECESTCEIIFEVKQSHATQRSRLIATFRLPLADGREAEAASGWPTAVRCSKTSFYDRNHVRQGELAGHRQRDAVTGSTLVLIVWTALSVLTCALHRPT